MPKTLTTTTMERLFPFEFYWELSRKLKDYAFHNPALLLPDNTPIAMDKRKDMYHASRESALIDTLNQQNILTVEPFGEVVLLDLCSPVSVFQQTSSKTEKTLAPLSFMIAQLYDSTDQPVLSKEVTQETIDQIPEILWDDPNLLLAVLTFDATEGGNVAVIKIPERIEQRIIEPIPDRDNTATHTKPK